MLDIQATQFDSDYRGTKVLDDGTELYDLDVFNVIIIDDVEMPITYSTGGTMPPDKRLAINEQKSDKVLMRILSGASEIIGIEDFLTESEAEQVMEAAEENFQAAVKHMAHVVGE